MESFGQMGDMIWVRFIMNEDLLEKFRLPEFSGSLK